MMTWRDFEKEFASMELWADNEEEIDRLEHIAAFVSLFLWSVSMSV